MRSWHCKTLDEVQSALGTSAESGLSRSEARKRLSENGPNNVFVAKRGDVVFYLKRVASGPLCLLMLVSAILAGIAGMGRTAYLLAFFTLILLLTAFVLYYRGRRLLENMEEYSLPSAKVLRDGRIYVISQQYVVKGDVILIEKGDIVPADARLISSDGLVIRETGIAGGGAEMKDARYIAQEDARPCDMKCMVFAATVAEQGRGFAIVCETGSETLVSRTKSKRKRPSFESLRLMIMQRRISGTFTAALLCLVFLMTVLCLFPIYKGKLLEGYLLALAFAAGAMSELYTVLTTVVIAGGIYGSLAGGYGGRGGAEGGAVIKELSAIDRLSDVDTVIIPPEALYDESRISILFTYSEGVEHPINASDSASAAILEYATLAGGIFGPSRLAFSGKGKSLDFEEEEILKVSTLIGKGSSYYDDKYTLISHETFKSEGNVDVSLVGEDGYTSLSVKGRPASVLSLCKFYREGGKLMRMTDKEREKLFALSGALAESGRMVKTVAFARERGHFEDEGYLSERLVFEGFICFSLPLVRGIGERLSECKRAGVRVVVFSEEGAQTLSLMKAAGMGDGISAVSGKYVKEMSDELLRTNIDLYSLYFGLRAADKLRVIKAMRASKSVVLYMGREQEEIVLMRSADVSATFGSTMSGKTEERLRYKAGRRDAPDSVRFVSSVIVSPTKRSAGGFLSLVLALERARGIHSSVFRMLAYLLASFVARSASVIATLFASQRPVSALSVLTLGFVFDLLAVMAVIFEEPPALYESGRVKEEIKRPIKRLALPLCTGVLASAITVFNLFLEKSFLKSGDVFSLTFIFLLLLVPVMLFENTRRESVFTGGVRVSVAFCLVLLSVIAFILLLCFTAVGGVYAFTRPTMLPAMLAIAEALIIFFVYELVKLFS